MKRLCVVLALFTFLISANTIFAESENPAENVTTFQSSTNETVQKNNPSSGSIGKFIFEGPVNDVIKGVDTVLTGGNTSSKMLNDTTTALKINCSINPIACAGFAILTPVKWLYRLADTPPKIEEIKKDDEQEGPLVKKYRMRAKISTEEKYFTIQEAETKTGKTVVSLVDFKDVPKGTKGILGNPTAYIEIENNTYITSVLVEWKVEGRAEPIIDYLSKDAFGNTVLEEY